MNTLDTLSATAPTTTESARRIGYVELVRSNRDFRNLWLGQVVSELGDWFSIIALFNLLLELTHRAQTVAWFLIIMHVPAVLIGPLGGVLLDRLDRKRMMISMDLARAVLVLGYFLVRRADQVWIVYLIAAVQTAMTTLFEPARTASVPNICRREELVAANALSSVTWSAMLTIGAALGGFVAGALGRNVCFTVDAVSFVLSAAFILRVRIAFHSDRGHPKKDGAETTSGLGDMLDGLRYIRCHPRVLILLLVKTGWCLGGGVLLVISVFGQNIFPVAESGAAGIGILYAARGIGTALGPIAARRLAGERHSGMRSSITAGFFLGSVFYILFGQAPWLPLAALFLLAAHLGGSITWVFSTVLLQLEVPDQFRGRVFAIEFALLTLAIAVSNYFTGYGLDVLRLDPRTVASLLGVYFIVPGLMWISAQRIFKT